MILYMDVSAGRSDNAKMNMDGPSIPYVNEVVLAGLSERGIIITPECHITNDHGLSSSELVAVLKERGWSWPTHWYRQNRNYLQHPAGATHLEKEIEPGRWIHIVVLPGLKKVRGRLGRSRKVTDWSLPPRHIELHAERGWLRPSSFRHLWDFLRGKLWPL